MVFIEAFRVYSVQPRASPLAFWCFDTLRLLSKVSNRTECKGATDQGPQTPRPPKNTASGCKGGGEVQMFRSLSGATCLA